MIDRFFVVRKEVDFFKVRNKSSPVAIFVKENSHVIATWLRWTVSHNALLLRHRHHAQRKPAGR